MILRTLNIVRHMVLFAAACVLLWTGGYLTFAAWVAGMKPDGAQKPTDAIVVLTGGARRVNTALNLLADGSAQQLFISGVNEAVSLSDIMAQWKSDPAQKESASCCIVLDHKAQNTAQNATEVGQWSAHNDITSIRLVTSAYHMPRAWLELRRARPDLEIRIHPVLPLQDDFRNGTFWRITFEEYHKTIIAFVNTRLWPEINVGDLKRQKTEPT